jgi:trimeric autotransporter adhesin
MANVKVSQLPNAAALTGTELIPVVQGGATVKTTRALLRGDTGNVFGGTSIDASNVAVGPGALAPQTVASFGNGGNIAIGSGAKAHGVNTAATPPVERGAVAVGLSSSANTYAVAIGARAIAGQQAVAIGGEVATTSSTTVAGVAIGHDIALNDTSHSCVVIGWKAASTNRENVSIGHQASTFRRSVAIGKSTAAMGEDAVALGQAASAPNANAVALGTGAITTASFQVMIGPRDLEITGIVKGVVLVDRALGTRRRVFLTNGVLSVEAA